MYLMGLYFYFFLQMVKVFFFHLLWIPSHSFWKNNQCILMNLHDRVLMSHRKTNKMDVNLVRIICKYLVMISYEVTWHF